jgi:hypothetical protein
MILGLGEDRGNESREGNESGGEAHCECFNDEKNMRAKRFRGRWAVEK